MKLFEKLNHAMSANMKHSLMVLATKKSCKASLKCILQQDAHEILIENGQVLLWLNIEIYF